MIRHCIIYKIWRQFNSYRQKSNSKPIMRSKYMEILMRILFFSLFPFRSFCSPPFGFLICFSFYSSFTQIWICAVLDIPRNFILCHGNVTILPLQLSTEKPCGRGISGSRCLFAIQSRIKIGTNRTFP